MRSLTITSSFRARRHAARGIPYDREVIILNSREGGYHTAKGVYHFFKAKISLGRIPEYNSLSRGKFENKDCGGSEDDGDNALYRRFFAEDYRARDERGEKSDHRDRGEEYRALRL